MKCNVLLLIPLIIFSISITFGQTTIAIQDFESSPATPTMTYSTTGSGGTAGTLTGSSGTGDRPASTAYASNGSRAYGVLNTSRTLTFDAVNTTGYTGISFSCRLASWSISSTGNGADATDQITVEVSPDNGTTWYTRVKVNGNTNAWWSYSATGSAINTYAANNTSSDYTPAGGGQRTTDGYSTITISSLPAVSQLQIRITLLNNATGERWTLDHAQITGTLATTPTITLNNNSQITAANVAVSMSDHILSRFTINVADANATLNALSFNIGGTFGTGNVSQFKLYTSLSNTFPGGTPLATINGSGISNGDNLNFSSLSQACNIGDRYFWITGDISSGATLGNTVSVPSLSNTNFTFASGTISGTISAGGAQTFIAGATPNVTLSSPSPSTGNMQQGIINYELYRFDLAVTTANATLTGVTINTAGTYVAADISNFKCWYSADNTFNAGTDVLLATKTSSLGTGSHIFPSFTSQNINSGTTGYVFITCDVPISSTAGNTISVNAISTTDISFSAANKSGLADGSGSKTIVTCTPVNISGLTLTPLNTQINVAWTNSSCFDEIMIAIKPSTSIGTSPSGDGSAYSANLNFGSGSSFDATGYVVYKGSTSPQIITGLTNGINYFVKIFTRKGTTWSTGVEANETPAAISSSTDYFRSKATGNWNSTSTWESSSDNSTWIDATLTPTSSANVVQIRNGHTVTISSGVTFDQVEVKSGGILNFNSSSIVVNNGTGDDIIIDDGGRLNYRNSGFSYSSSAIRIKTGAVLAIEISGITGSGAAIHSASHIYEDGAILEYNLTSVPSSSNITYFPNVTTEIPIFRFAQTIGSNIGATTNPTTFNGILELNNGVTINFGSSGIKTFRNGIRCIGNATVNFSTGSFEITGTSAQLGSTSGGTLTISNSSTSTISSTITLQGNCVFTGTSGITNNGSIILNNKKLTINSALSGSGTITGSSDAELEFTGSGAVALNPDNTSASTRTFKNVTINKSVNNTTLGGNFIILNELNLSSGTFLLNGNHLTLSGASLNVTSGSLTGSATSDLTVSGSSGGIVTIPNAISIRNLTINDSRRVKLSGNLTLSGILDVSANAIFDNGGENQITASGSPSINISGTFITEDEQGFIGTGTAIPSITPTLNSGCTIQYNRAGDQNIQSTITYPNLIISNSGIKTPSSALNVSGTITIQDNAILNGTSNNIGGSGTNLTMTGGRLIVGTSGTQPNCTGTYTLTGGVIEFAGSSSKSIRSPLNYNQIEVSGSNVGIGSGNITLISGGSFTIKNGGVFTKNNNRIVGPTGSQTLTIDAGGVFVCNDIDGFSGSSLTSVGTDIENIILTSGSTVRYSRAGAQVLTAGSYSNLEIDGSSEKTLNGTVTVNKKLNLITGSIALASNILNLNDTAILYTNIISGNGNINLGNSSVLQTTDPSGISSNIPSANINFSTGSTVDYNRNGDQIITNNLAYSNLSVSGSGIKNWSGNYQNFNNIQISGSAKLELSAGSVVTIGGNLNNAVTDGFILRSTGMNAANNVSLITNGNIIGAGTAIVERYLSNNLGNAEERGFYVSSPIAAASTSVFNSANASNRMWFYDETINNWSSPITPASPQSLTIGRGYIARTFIHNTAFEFKGNLNSGNQTINFSPGINRWMLVGNPYPSAISWNSSGITKTGIQNKIWINTGNNNFAYYNGNTGDSLNGGSQFIASGQSFWVLTNAASSSLSFGNSSRTHFGNTALLRAGIESSSTGIKKIKLKVINLSQPQFKDEIIIRFEANALEELDINDMTKRIATAAMLPQLYTQTGTTRLAMNSLPELISDRIIPIGLRIGIQGGYKIELVDEENLKPQFELVLEDLHTGIKTPLFMHEGYKFDATISDNTSRFRLIFTTQFLPDTDDSHTNSSTLMMPMQQFLTQLNLKNNTQVSMYSLEGKLICENLQSCQLKSFNEYSKGIYIIKIIEDSKVKTVFLQN